MNDKTNSNNQPQTIDDIIDEIKRKSSDGDYIYRGEREDHDDVSSALYREYSNYINIDLEGFDMTYAQKEMLKIAKNHIGGPPKRVLENFKYVRSHIPRSISIAAIDQTLQRIIERDEEDEALEILTELQHYGGKTNLIDFTTDYLIAIYFACSGEPKAEGRIILVKKTKEIMEMTIRPHNPRHRVIVQKSIFIAPPQGFIDVNEDKKVKIPATLKEEFLKYLEKHHDISTETIYNDIHGFIRYQNIHQNAYTQFYIGLTFQHKGYSTEVDKERQEHYKEAIKHYDEAIDLNSEMEVAYHNRGECWLHLGKWNQAKKDIKISMDMGLDSAYGFRNDYEGGVAEFENKTGLTVPPDIAEMLGD